MNIKIKLYFGHNGGKLLSQLIFKCSAGISVVKALELLLFVNDFSLNSQNNNRYKQNAFLIRNHLEEFYCVCSCCNPRSIYSTNSPVIDVYSPWHRLKQIK